MCAVIVELVLFHTTFQSRRRCACAQRQLVDSVVLLSCRQIPFFFFIRTNQIKPVEFELPAACLMSVRSYVSLWTADTNAGKKKKETGKTRSLKCSVCFLLLLLLLEILTTVILEDLLFPEFLPGRQPASRFCLAKLLPWLMFTLSENNNLLTEPDWLITLGKRKTRRGPGIIPGSCWSGAAAIDSSCR